MIIECDQVETVTDKGWIIITNNTDTKKSGELIEEDKERRESLDSGVSIEHLQLSISNAKTKVGGNGDVQVDSGCESLKGTESDEGVRRATRQFSMHDIHISVKNEGTEDSGLGLGHHDGSGSLEGDDIGPLSKVEVGDGYRSQSPSSVNVQNDMGLNKAAPSAGYRSGQVACKCSDHEYCIWCKIRTPFTADCRLVTRSDSGQTNVGNSESSSSLKSLMQTVNLLNMDIPLTEPVLLDNTCAESAVILWPRSLLLQNEKKHTKSFTLNNIELTFS